MTNKPLVSVIIPVYNAERFLRETLESVLAQTYKPIEVIVVNDGSTDESQQILNEYAGRIRCFHQENAGVAAARNRGISDACGEWVAFLDADDLWDAQKIEIQMSGAKEDDHVVYTNARKIDASGRVTSDKMRSGLAWWHKPPWLLNLFLGDMLPMLTVVVRREALLSVGGFDRGNRFGTDDYELWLRLAATGHNFRFIDRALASYRVHDRNLSADKTRMQRGHVYAIERTREEYPQAFGKREIKVYHERLHSLHWAVAWDLYEQGERQEAARHFRRAILHRPGCLKTRFFAAALSLPLASKALPHLRRWVQRLAK